jgi:dUTP pyrophosphatase
MSFFKVIKGEKTIVPNNSWSSKISVKIVADSLDFVPSFQTDGAAGADLKSSIDIILEPMKVAMVDAGFSCKIPDGYHAKIVARSSMGKKGIIIPNSPGIIDSDYINRICVLLLNLTSEPYEIKKGDRIAQWLLESNTFYSWQEVSELGKTDRQGGFGSTGV